MLDFEDILSIFLIDFSFLRNNYISNFLFCHIIPQYLIILLYIQGEFCPQSDIIPTVITGKVNTSIAVRGSDRHGNHVKDIVLSHLVFTFPDGEIIDHSKAEVG